MTNLYPPIKPNNSGQLKVSDLHEIYYEESGNPDGIPMIRIHGGPGGNSKPDYRTLYNPEKYRIILYDQRGCGKSTPLGETKENTTNDLIEDMEKLRKHLNIEKWYIHGGSWGSTLALAYCETYPDKVLRLLVNGIFLAHSDDISWVFEGGPKNFYPNEWKAVVNALSIYPGDSTLEKYANMLKSSFQEIPIERLKACVNWERILSYINPEIDQLDWTNEEILKVVINQAKLQVHYMKNGCFLEENQLLKNADKLKNIPMDIVHGRYDLVCPIKNAFDLKERLPDAKFHIVQIAGHSTSEEGIVGKIREITDSLKN